MHSETIILEIKKIFLWIIVLISLIFWNLIISSTTNAWIEDSSFMINTSDLLWTSNTIKQTTAKATIDKWLEVTVQKMMVALWVIALFIMTIGWWYMIFAHGQDELLNKWKSIFNAWLIALIVALSSSIIMKVVIYLLYIT